MTAGTYHSTNEAALNAESAPFVEESIDNKRKLSMSATETSATKKVKLDSVRAPVRYFILRISHRILGIVNIQL